MKLLLDTHALVWWWTDNPRLPAAGRTAVAAADNEILVSAASAWEIATKSRLGKWPEVAPLVDDFVSLVRRSRFTALPVTAEHAIRAGCLAGPHRDPFDRMLIAQCMQEGSAIVSADPVFASYGLAAVWDD